MAGNYFIWRVYFDEIEIRGNKYLPRMPKYKFKGIRENEKLKKATPEETERAKKLPLPQI